MDALRDRNQERFYEIWTRMNSGYALEGDDRTIGELMRAHPEYYRFWNDPKRYAHHRFDPSTDELDPFLHHILMGLTVKGQVALNDPPSGDGEDRRSPDRQEGALGDGGGPPGLEHRGRAHV